MGLHPKNDQIAASPISTEICFTEWMLCVGHLNPSKAEMHSQFSTTCVEYIEGSTSNIFWQCKEKIVAKESNNNFAAAIQCNAMQCKAMQCNAMQSNAMQSKAKQI